MKVRVGDTIYDGSKEPVMLILTDKDKENIRNMAPLATKYCQFPDEVDPDYIDAWRDRPGKRRTSSMTSRKPGLLSVG